MHYKICFIYLVFILLFYLLFCYLCLTVANKGYIEKPGRSLFRNK